MITYEQDPDVVRWGLHLLDGDPYSNSEYCGNSIEHDTNLYNGQYTGDSHFEAGLTTVENDEILAHALQEELAQLAVAEASGSSQAGEEQLQASILAQDWLYPSTGNFNSGIIKVA